MSESLALCRRTSDFAVPRIHGVTRCSYKSLIKGVLGHRKCPELVLAPGPEVPTLRLCVPPGDFSPSLFGSSTAPAQRPGRGVAKLSPLPHHKRHALPSEVVVVRQWATHARAPLPRNRPKPSPERIHISEHRTHLRCSVPACCSPCCLRTNTSPSLVHCKPRIRRSEPNVFCTPKTETILSMLDPACANPGNAAFPCLATWVSCATRYCILGLVPVSGGESTISTTTNCADRP